MSATNRGSKRPKAVNLRINRYKMDINTALTKSFRISRKK